MKRTYLTILNTRYTMNGLREVIPRDNALITKMVHARFYALFDSCEDSHSQITGIRRCTNLVEDDAQLRTLLSKTDHRLHEIIAEGGIKPGRTDNHCLSTSFLSSFFTSQFGTTISTIGAHGIRLHIRGMVGTVKHIVGRNLDDPTATLLNSSSQIARGHRIQGCAKFLVLFCLIHSGIGSTVHDTVNLIVTDKSLYCLLIGDIQLCHIRIKIGMLGIQLLQQLHLVSQLAITACY